MSEARELRGRSSEELRKELVELKREQFNLRMQRGTGQLGSPARFKELRREVARIKTVLNEKATEASQTA
ncbi:MAG: 50S ribosomal protein L29 [Gammaproteobacteria bacterium]|nr:50S ribosomal protein L29 [Gammaproteobacteria bacterium]NIW87027.1 50S ribosomal protein L29 [Gammaproteobacteria bacterium]